MAMLHGTGVPAMTYEAALAEAMKAGWQMVSEGPSGAQLKGPKKMRALDKGCLVVGVVIGAVGHIVAGGFLIAIAIIDYAFFTKERTAFLARSHPVAVR